MPDISPSIPVTGQPNATEEPKIVTALSTLVATVNALDTANYADLSVTTAKIADLSVTAAKIEAQQAWQTIAMTGLTGNLAYYKDSLGIVRFRGDRFGAPSTGTSVTLCTMPVGYRPGNSQSFAILQFSTASGNLVSEVTIDATGVVVARAVSATAGTYHILSAVQYRAEV